MEEEIVSEEDEEVECELGVHHHDEIGHALRGMSIENMILLQGKNFMNGIVLEHVREAMAEGGMEK